MSFYIGVDGGGTKTAFSLFDEDKNVVKTVYGPGSNHENLEGAFDEASAVIWNGITELVGEAGISLDDVAFSLMGLAGIDHQFQHDIMYEKLSEILAERLGFPVTIDNDTRAMTYGEMVKGAVKDEKNIVFVNMSWGLGSGLIINGDIYTGKSGFSGEIGHFPVFDNEILCHCGKTGCLETEVSGMALHRNLLKSVREGRQSILSERIMKDEQSVTLDDIVEAINKEDLLCIELVEEIGQKMGRYLAGLINLLNPELVVIGGVLAETGDYILQPIKSAVRKYSLNLVNKDSAIVLSKLKERAGVIGACMLARKSMFES